MDTAAPLAPGLYIAATPIGNLKDVTHRVVETLARADRILCEDTRQTAKLCAAFGIATPRSTYNDHNAKRARPAILEALKKGAAICLVSDAGTPLISDPGYRLVREARDAGIAVFPLPGPSALIAALSAAGAPTDRFFFAGFPPAKDAARRKFLEDLARLDATLVFYEAPQRLGASLSAMFKVFGERRAAVARELTKLYEEIDEGALADLAAKYEAAPPRGEIVVIIHPPADEAPAGEEDIDVFLAEALSSLSVKEAASAAADVFGIPKKSAYARALALRRQE